MSSRFPSHRPRRIVLRMIAGAAMLVGGLGAQQDTPAARVKAVTGAKQIGVSCAFFANVPVLTEIGGIRIADGTAESREFIAGIYGLRHGDTRFRSAFDRGLFFELFGIPAQAVRIDHPGTSRREALDGAGALIREIVRPALENGEFLSIRARGPFGGPHNMLLVGHSDGFYHLHDPTSGTIIRIREPGLAAHLVSESKAGSRSGGRTVKKRYFTSFHRISTGPPREARPLTISQLPAGIELPLTGDQRQVLSDSLLPDGSAGPAADVGEIVARFPDIDFAVIGRSAKGGTRLVSAIGPEVPAPQLVGAAHLARLSLTSHQIGARRLLPVWVIDGRPHVVTGLAASGPDGGTVTWFDGRETATVPLPEALKRLRASGALIGYVGTGGK